MPKRVSFCPSMTRSLDDDISLLNSLLSQDNLDESDEASVVELMQRLESADGVAKGMESKLDVLLGNLDTLLAVLEKNGPVKKQEDVGGDEKGVSA
ncbi:hypothetical protein DFS33DRAFT_1306780 [Desarmillaria ectypa]|nr:hypothetical protein DFS33DRAFT_1306780 [Desarmillaria ectypa]